MARKTKRKPKAKLPKWVEAIAAGVVVTLAFALFLAVIFGSALFVGYLTYESSESVKCTAAIFWMVSLVSSMFSLSYYFDGTLD